MKIFFKYSLCVFILCQLLSCATSTKQTPETFSNFTRGESRLTCGVSCSGTWGYSRKQAKSFYENALWNDLAKLVIEIGYENQLSYFYLGRSAEGIGYSSAARTYYTLASASRACDSTFNNCDGFNFPVEINLRMAGLPKSNSVDANKSNTIDLTKNFSPATTRARFELSNGWEQKELLESMILAGISDLEEIDANADVLYRVKS